MISHRAVLSTISGIMQYLEHLQEKITCEDSFLSFLPLAHIMDRCGGVGCVGCVVGWMGVGFANLQERITCEDSFLSFLPLAHIMDRCGGVGCVACVERDRRRVWLSGGGHV